MHTVHCVVYLPWPSRILYLWLESSVEQSQVEWEPSFKIDLFSQSYDRSNKKYLQMFWITAQCTEVRFASFLSSALQWIYYCHSSSVVCKKVQKIGLYGVKWTQEKYSWVPNRRVYSFIWHQRNMKNKTDTKTDKSI